MTEIEVFKF